MKIIIPARSGSKGLPGKNRKLFDFTASIIPEDFIADTFVLTDDPEIYDYGSGAGFGGFTPRLGG